MAEQRRTFWIGIISALAALITAGTSVYVTLREEVRVARPPGAGEAPLAEVERLLERYERRLADLETERRRLAEDGEEMADPGEFYALRDELAAAERSLPSEDGLLHVLEGDYADGSGFYRVEASDPEAAVRMAELLRRRQSMQDTLFQIMDRYDGTAREVIESMGG